MRLDGGRVMAKEEDVEKAEERAEEKEMDVMEKEKADSMMSNAAEKVLQCVMCLPALSLSRLPSRGVQGSWMTRWPLCK